MVRVVVFDLAVGHRGHPDIPQVNIIVGNIVPLLVDRPHILRHPAVADFLRPSTIPVIRVGHGRDAVLLDRGEPASTYTYGARDKKQAT